MTHPTDALVERLRQACQPIADMEILTSNPVDEDIAIVSMRTVLAIRAALSAMPDPAMPSRESRIGKYLADEAGARERLKTFPPEFRQRLAEWQTAQSEWFSDTLLEIVSEFMAYEASLPPPPGAEPAGEPTP